MKSVQTDGPKAINIQHAAIMVDDITYTVIHVSVCVHCQLSTVIQIVMKSCYQ